MSYTPEAIQNVKIHFEREPSYSKEALMKSLKDEYNVEYVMKVDRATTKVVVDTTPSSDIEREESSKSNIKDEITRRTVKPEVNRLSDMNKIGVTPEMIIEKSESILKAFPSFNTKTEAEKMVFIADLIGGKFDDIVFGDLKVADTKPKELSKPIKAYKESYKTI